jgi:hypothetical protein
MASMKQKPLWLVAEGEFAVLKMESNKGNWVELIRERLDAPFSHIIEPLGIIRKMENHQPGVNWLPLEGAILPKGTDYLLLFDNGEVRRFFEGEDESFPFATVTHYCLYPAIPKK